jgi:hypothetical protein
MSRKHSIRIKTLDNFTCSGVYGIHCEPTRRLYVGMSENILRRWTEHSFQLHNGNHPQKAVVSDYKWFGSGNFILFIIERVFEDCRKDLRLKLRELAAFWMFTVESQTELELYNPLDWSKISCRKPDTYEPGYREQRYRAMTEDARLLIPEGAVMGHLSASDSDRPVPVHSPEPASNRSPNGWYGCQFLPVPDSDSDPQRRPRKCGG